MGIQTNCCNNNTDFYKCEGRCCYKTQQVVEQPNGDWQWIPGTPQPPTDIAVYCDPVCNQPPALFPDVISTGLTITKTGDTSNLSDPPLPGEQVVYSFTISNIGAATITNIAVTDLLLTMAGGPITLASAATDTTTFTGTYAITQADIDAGQIVNTAEVEGETPDGCQIWATTTQTTLIEASPPLAQRYINLTMPTQPVGQVATDFLCYPCPNPDGPYWQIRIDDALADEDNPANPLGDRLNDDPGIPEPVDQVWVDEPDLDGEKQIYFASLEVWPDGQDPDQDIVDVGNEFTLHVRASCDKLTWDAPVTVTYIAGV